MQVFISLTELKCFRCYLAFAIQIVVDVLLWVSIRFTCFTSFWCFHFVLLFAVIDLLQLPIYFVWILLHTVLWSTLH